MAEGYVEIPMTEFAGSGYSEGSEEHIESEKGPADLIDDILDQIWIHPGITISEGCIRFPQNFNQAAEFYVSGLLNIQRNSTGTVKEFKNGSIVEIICPLIIPNLEIEFERSVSFCCIPLCERASLVAGSTTAEVEMSVFNGNVALDFVRITSMEDIDVQHEGSSNACCKTILRRKLVNLKREYEEKIKEAVTHFICKMVNKILRTYAMDEKIRFQSIEDDEDMYEHTSQDSIFTFTTN